MQKQKVLVNQGLFNNHGFPTQFGHLSGLPQVGIFSSQYKGKDTENENIAK